MAAATLFSAAASAFEGGQVGGEGGPGETRFNRVEGDADDAADCAEGLDEIVGGHLAGLLGLPAERSPPAMRFNSPRNSLSRGPGGRGDHGACGGEVAGRRAEVEAGPGRRTSSR